MDSSRDRTTGSQWIGRAVQRVEDEALVRGLGCFVDDLDPPHCLHLQFLRSTRASGRIRAIAVAGALAMPGVIDVLVGADVAGLANLAVNPLLDGIRLPSSSLLAIDEIRAVGQPLAAVVATRPTAALDAMEAITVDVDETLQSADCSDVFEKRWTAGNVDEAFASAAHIVGVKLCHARLAPAPLEPRRALVTADRNGKVTAWLATQTPHRARIELSRIIGIPETDIRVIAPDVGGAFGGKASIYPEDVVVALAALRLRRPVKWCASRLEDFQSATHGRGAAGDGELALAADGRFLGLRARFAFPLGFWLPFSAVVPARNAGRILPGPYAIDNIDITVRGRQDNTAAMGIYRGAGRPEAAMLMERLVEQAARACDIDPLELRARNLLPPERLPHVSPTGELIDSGNFPLLLARARERARYNEMITERDRRRTSGVICGIGLALYLEPTGQAWESATVRLDSDGFIVAATGATAQGQGRETSFAQIVADVLGIDPSRVRVVHGDTESCPAGIGALASRSTAIGGSALLAAAEKFREAARRCAARLLDRPIDQVALNARGFESCAAREHLSWPDLAAAIRDPGQRPAEFAEDLSSTIVYHAEGEAWSSGCCVAQVALDRETGEVRVERLVWIDDAGIVVNPMLVRGQCLGGMAQGLGEALLERLVYDADGQLITASLMDYALPRAGDVPGVELDHIETPSPSNLLGAKGVGEAGCIGVPAAIVNAILDALAPHGITHLDMPVTSEAVWRALNTET